MYVYLLHSFVLYPFRESGVLRDLEPTWIWLPIVVVASVLIALGLATKPVRRALPAPRRAAARLAVRRPDASPAARAAAPTRRVRAAPATAAAAARRRPTRARTAERSSVRRTGRRRRTSRERSRRHRPHARADVADVLVHDVGRQRALQPDELLGRALVRQEEQPGVEASEVVVAVDEVVAAAQDPRAAVDVGVREAHVAASRR